MLIDIFDYLDLNELEKCQLVSIRWFRILKYGRKWLLERRRYIYELQLDVFPKVRSLNIYNF